MDFVGVTRVRGGGGAIRSDKEDEDTRVFLSVHCASSGERSGFDTRKRECSERTVGRGVDRLGQFGDGHFEPALNRLEHLLVLVVRDKRDRKTLGPEPARTADPVEVRVGVSGRVIVDDNVDALDVDTATKHVGRDEDSLLERLELLEQLDPLLLREATVNRDRRELALVQELVELARARDRLDKDDDLQGGDKASYEQAFSCSPRKLQDSSALKVDAAASPG